MPSSPARPLTRRLPPALTLAMSVLVLVAALLGPAQSLAQTRKLSCSSSSTHPRSKHTSHACVVRPSHKRKAHHAAGRHGKHSLAGGAPGTTVALVPATCEDGSTPVQAADGSFSCDDGSAPECEDGSTPTPADKGTSLVCAVPIEDLSEDEEAECEEELTGACTVEPISGANEQTCTTSPASSSGFVCEAGS